MGSVQKRVLLVLLLQLLVLRPPAAARPLGIPPPAAPRGGAPLLDQLEEALPKGQPRPSGASKCTHRAMPALHRCPLKAGRLGGSLAAAFTPYKGK